MVTLNLKKSLLKGLVLQFLSYNSFSVFREKSCYGYTGKNLQKYSHYIKLSLGQHLM